MVRDYGRGHMAPVDGIVLWLMALHSVDGIWLWSSIGFSGGHHLGLDDNTQFFKTADVLWRTILGFALTVCDFGIL